MIATIEKVLKELSVKTYLINEIKESRAESYYIKKNLDMRRLVDETQTRVTVYRDFEEDGKKFRGSAVIIISPEMGEESIKKELENAYFAAQFVKNPYFELPTGKKERMKLQEGKLELMQPTDIMDEFVQCLFAKDTREDAFINTAEFFVKKSQRRILNSEGVDVCFTKNSVTGEFVVQSKKPQDVELYYDFDYRDLDLDSFGEKVEEALETVCARAKATEAPKGGTYDILLSDTDAAALFELFEERSEASIIYAKYSPYKIGDQIQGDEIIGDKVSVTLTANVPYDNDGLPMKDCELMKDGKLLSYHGESRYCQYIKAEPTGRFQSKRVESGNKSIEELKEKPYLMPVAFSDFMMDSFTGYFGGEMRLAYYFDGKETHLVTGGSITGNFLECMKDMELSKERYKDSYFDTPKMVRLKNVSVAGD